MHTHQPYTLSTFKNDEIRIIVQSQDHCLLPSKSPLHVDEKLVKNNETVLINTVLVCNAICHFFEEARYEINAIEIDRNKTVGLTSLMKNYASLNSRQSRYIENTTWVKIDN